MPEAHIVKVRWPTSNEKLWRFTKFEKIKEMIKGRKMNWPYAKKASRPKTILLVNIWAKTSNRVVRGVDQRVHGEDLSLKRTELYRKSRCR